jgi:hypothetical protein
LKEIKSKQSTCKFIPPSLPFDDTRCKKGEWGEGERESQFKNEATEPSDIDCSAVYMQWCCCCCYCFNVLVQIVEIKLRNIGWVGERVKERENWRKYTSDNCWSERASESKRE